MMIYTHDPTIDGNPAKVIKAWIPRGVCVITTDDDSRTLWVSAAEYRKVAADGITSIEAGLALEDLTSAQLKALAKAKGVKTSGKKADLVSRVRTALALGSK